MSRHLRRQGGCSVAPVQSYSQMRMIVMESFQSPSRATSYTCWRGGYYRGGLYRRITKKYVPQSYQDKDRIHVSCSRNTISSTSLEKGYSEMNGNNKKSNWRLTILPNWTIHWSPSLVGLEMNRHQRLIGNNGHTVLRYWRTRTRRFLFPDLLIWLILL